MITGFIEESIIKRARDKGLVEFEIINLRDCAIDSYGTVDNRPYGGGTGMVIRADVIDKAINKTHQSNTKYLLTSAKGKPFNQKKAIELSKLDKIVIFAGHYEGVDERALPLFDEELSLGDFVMTGGEITAIAVSDAIVRLIPGVLKKENATTEESFFEIPVEQIVECVGENPILKDLIARNIKTVKLLEYPHYTRPEIYKDMRVPEILLSGNPKKIRAWQIKCAWEETVKKRPDLIKSA